MNNRQNTANTPDAGCRINIAEKEEELISKLNRVNLF